METPQPQPQAQPLPTAMPKKSRRRIPIIIAVVVLVVLLVGAASWYTWNKRHKKTTTTTTATTATLKVSEEAAKNAKNAAGVPANAANAPTNPSKPLIDASTTTSTAMATFWVFPTGTTSPTQVAQEWFMHNSKVVNPSTISVAATVKNIGGDPGAPNCTITAQNDDGSNTGTATVARPSLAAGATADFTTNVTVSNQGAQSVTQINATCL
jgi:outer membrane murein-binding lipoprotein Lpp